MRIFVLILALTAMPALAQTCPPAPDQSAIKSRLMAQVRVAPDALSARALTHELWMIWATAPDATAQGYLDNGMERREAYDYDKASEFFDLLVDYCPDYAEGYNQRAFINFLRGDYATALEDLDIALDMAPDHIAALAGRALTLMNLGRVEAGQAALRQALEMNPWLPERGMLLPETRIAPKGEEL